MGEKKNPCLQRGYQGGGKYIMRIGKRIRLLMLLAGLFLCCTFALGDSGGIGLPQYSEIPVGWTTQESGENPGDLLDGYISTAYQHVCRNSNSNDGIPEITFYFNNATLKNIWIRNGNQSDINTYYAYARVRQLNISVYTADGAAVTYQYQMQDAYDPDNTYTGWFAGYQCLTLPRTFQRVIRVELWIPRWYQGNESPHIVCMTDIAFAADDSGGSYQPTPRPTSVPTPQPTPNDSRDSYHPQVTLNQRLATRSGPGTQYTELGSYFQEGTVLTAISAAYDDRNGIWWIQTEFTYHGEKRRAYTGLKRLNMQVSDVPQEYAIRYAVVNRSVYAYWGPGYDYTMYKNPIPAGTEGTVWQTENGYAQLEFYDSSEALTRRVWIPESALEAHNG